LYLQQKAKHFRPYPTVYTFLLFCYDQISFVSQPCVCPGVIMQWWCEISCIFSFP